MKRIASLGLITIMLIASFSISVLAQDTQLVDSKQEVYQKVYSEEYTQEQWDLAKAQPIYADKTKDGKVNTVSTKSSGTYPTRPGVILVTADKYKGLIPTGHAGIIWLSNVIVESLENGVTTGPNNWNTAKDTCYGVTTYGTTYEEDSAAANWCYSQIGKPYNWFYPDKWTRSKFYCSQLVYAAFLDLYDIDLDTWAYLSAVHPMELVNTDNTYTIYEK